jgi:hypothetical protein
MSTGVRRERLQVVDVVDRNLSAERIDEAWRRARAFLHEALANGPLTESELFQRAARLGIPDSSLWGVLTNLPPCTVLRETCPGGRDPLRIWAVLSPDLAEDTAV